METKFFVVRAYRYRESGSWEYNLVGMYSDLSVAKQAYHSNMGAIIKPTNDFAMVTLFDSFGTPIASDFCNTYVEPQENESEE